MNDVILAYYIIKKNILLTYKKTNNGRSEN